MNVLIMPNEKEINDFCDRLRSTMLDALKDGRPVILKHKAYTREQFSPEYGLAPVDVYCCGDKFIAEHGEPAVKSIYGKESLK